MTQSHETHQLGELKRRKYIALEILRTDYPETLQVGGKYHLTKEQAARFANILGVDAMQKLVTQEFISILQ